MDPEITPQAGENNIPIPAESELAKIILDQRAASGKPAEAIPEPKPELEVKPEEAAKKPAETVETKPDEAKDKPEEAKPGEDGVIDEVDLLKQTGFSETSFEELRKNYVNNMNRAKLANFGLKNIPGFEAYLKEQADRSRRGEAIIPFNQWGQETKPEAKPAAQKPAANTDAELEAFRMVDPSTGEEMTLAEKKAYIERYKTMNRLAGGAFREDIDGAFTQKEQQSQAEKAQAKYQESVNSMQTLVKDFGESIADDLKALKKPWVNETDLDDLGNPKSGVMFEVMKIIEDDFGIEDPSKVTKPRLERAWKNYLLDTNGGLEMIKTNAEKNVEERLKRKVRLKTVTQTQVEKAKAPGSLKQEIKPLSFAESLAKIKESPAYRGY